MIFPEILINLAPVLLAAVLLVITGLKKKPGMGIIDTVIIILVVIWFRGDDLSSLGFNAPERWPTTILLGLLLGITIQLFSILLVEPLTERLTGSTHDLSNLENVKGSWWGLLQWIVAVWLVVAFIEEGIYRGFLMTEMKVLIGDQPWGLMLNLLLSSMIFGLSHGYQGRAGIWSTGIIGLFLGAIFIFSDFNIWLAIFTHGFIDTVGLALIAVDGDKYIRNIFWKSVNH